MRTRLARIQSSPWPVYLLVALVAFVVFLPWVQGYFLGDDWMLLARNTGRPLPDLLRQASDASNSRWYRPLSESSLGMSWRLFGMNPVGHHLLNSALHTLNAVLVAAIGSRLARDLRVGLLAGLSFGLLACHTEAVVWITARHEMLAAAFALLGMTAYIRFRDTDRWRWWIGALSFYVISLGFKETTLALPLFWVLYDLIFCRLRWLGDFSRHPWKSAGAGDSKNAKVFGNSFAPLRLGARHLSVRQWVSWLFPLILAGAYALFRLRVGGGYNVPFHVLQALKNLVYYSLMEIVALPVSTYFLARFPFATLPVVAALIVACVLILWLAWERARRDRVVWFGALWMVFALAPVILIVAERTTYFSSAGWAWVIAAMVILAWDAAVPAHLPSRRLLVTFAMAGMLGANLVALTHKSYQWNRVADLSRDVFSQVQAALVDLSRSPGSQLWLVNPPGHVEYSEALGDRMLFGVWLLQGQLGTGVQAVLVQNRESKLAPREDMRQLLMERSVGGPVVAFYWQGGALSEPGTLESIRLLQ